MNKLSLKVAFALSLISPVLAHAEPSTLEKAYLKELAFLKAEKAELEKRLAAIDAETVRRTSLAQGELDALQGRLLTLKREADETAAQLEQGAAQGLVEKSEVTLETLSRAKALLEPAGYSVPSLPADREPAGAELEAAVTGAFEGAAKLLKDGAEIRREPGVFFMPGGEQVSGELLRIGRVAAYGVSTSGAGALLPAGEGRLRLHTEPAAATARALAAGQAVSELPIFLFESTEAEVKLKKELTLEEETNAGGPIAWLILVVGILAAFMIVYRAFALFFLGRSGERLTRETVQLVLRGQVREALQVLALRRGPIARVLTSTLTHLSKDRAALDDMVHEAVLHEVPAIERFGAAINVLAAVAPLLGLLGTVTGMISTFDILTEVGNSDPKMLSAGISEALITTKYGLVVAIPALLAGSLLGAKADQLLASLQHAALRVANAADGLAEESEPRAKTPIDGEPRDSVLGGALPAQA